MASEKKELCRIRLETWQQRMVKDFLGIECDKMKVPADSPLATKSGTQQPDRTQGQCMYLTDEQIQQIKDELGTARYFIEIREAEGHLRYGLSYS